jgi:formate dehydrogenase alpha subunit
MPAIRLTIDGREVDAAPGQSVLEAAQAVGIAIPTLCHHPDLSPVGSCRLCIVEVEGARGPVAACTEPAREGLVVRTETGALARSRRLVLELLLHDYHDAGRAAGDGAETEFEHWVRRYQARPPGGGARRARHRVDSDPNPFVRVDLDQCILCTRCVRACAEIQGRFVWGLGRRGAATTLIAGADTTLLEARCELCSACVTYCPTGALADKPSVDRGPAEARVGTVCPYCGVGCGFDLEVRAGRLLRVAPNPRAPVNGLRLCVKGRNGYAFVHHPERLTAPRVRAHLLEGRRRRPGEPRGAWVTVDWDTALDVVARALVQVREASGPDAIGVLASAKCTNEENYLIQKFARQVLGTHNVDHCARLCHASTIAGLRTSLGSGAMTNTMRDIVEHARAVFVIGSNTTEQHPVFGTMLRQAVLRRDVTLVVADPRAIDLAEFAALHVRHRPGTDVALLNGLMHVILEQGWHDAAFVEARTEGLEALRQTVERYPPARVAEIAGVPVETLRRAAELLARHRPMAVVWAMGITQHTTGVLNVLSLANLQLLLGNLGVPGGGLNPLRGQNNVQGACDMGALPDVFPGYQPVADPGVRTRFAAAWALGGADGTPDAAPPFGDTPGGTVVELVHRAGAGTVRALYVVGEDPMMTDPDVNHVRRCLEACELLVLQEILPSETAAFADVLLPGASWAEKDGTFTNTERRIQLVRQAIAPVGEARPDWAIVAAVARRVLERRARVPLGPLAGWAYPSPAAIMDEIAAVTPPYAGVSHGRLERGDVLHWPVPDAAQPGTPILHVDRFPRGRGRFVACEHLPPAELPDAEYPLYLTTGRVLYHWHGGELTRRVPGLLEVYPRTLVEISPEDAARAGLRDGGRVRVHSRRGEVTAHAVVTPRVAPGVVFGNFHFPGAQNVNNLTIAALDPVAKIPEYKVCAVRIEPA